MAKCALLGVPVLDRLPVALDRLSGLLAQGGIGNLGWVRSIWKRYARRERRCHGYGLRTALDYHSELKPCQQEEQADAQVQCWL